MGQASCGPRVETGCPVLPACILRIFEEDGTVSEFLVENEDAVDAGQDLVELE